MKFKDGVLVERLGDVGVIFDNNTSTLHEFNEVGYLIVSMIEENMSHAKMVAKIVDEYRISEARAKKDLKEFIRQLKDKGLI